jgi:chemotaxis protein MotB
MKRFTLFILLAGIAVACVPPTRFKALQSESMSCQEERDRLRAENEQITVENKEIRSRLAMAEKKLDRAGRDTLRWKQEVNQLTDQHNRLLKDYQDLQEANQALLNSLSADVSARKSELEKMQIELDQRNIRLAELEQVLKSQDTVLTALKKKVSDALLGFENQGLTVTQKNGKVYVSLDEKLLFKSGSTVVDPKGISALKKLAPVLEQNPDINVMIEGHTDDVPVMAGSTYKDNWDLSVLRATSIVRKLLDGTSINPQRLTTAGRSQYQPVDQLKTPEARQKNRRTEIILSPRLDELYKIIDK